VRVIHQYRGLAAELFRRIDVEPSRPGG
jgi:hypothetical protein